MTTFALDIVISKLRGLNTAGRIQCGIARLGSAQQNTAKSPEIDTRKNSTFPAALFRILVQDTIYDKVIISVFRNKKLSRDLLGHVVIPVSCVSTMSCVPRATTCWLPIRKPKDAQFAQRGELLVSLSFLDGLVTTSLPRTLTVPTPGSVVVKVVEAQSIGTVRADICASVFVSSLKHPLEQRTSTKHKVLCPVWNEDFHFDIAEPLVDVITVELKTPKRYIGKTTIPVSHVAFRAGLSNGKASCDFWWPLLDKMAHNQLQNFKTQGKLHIVMYYNTQPPKAEWKEPVNLVAHVQRLSSKNKWVSRYLLLQGSTTVPATIYNFHERGWAEAQMLDHATSGVVAVGAKIGGVRVPASVSCPQDRTLSFTAFDSSTHVFVFEDSATRDTWYQALLQLATVEGNWYDPNLDGVTPTLCAIAPLVRSQSDHKPGSESTLKRKGLLKTQPSSASLLTTQMNYFIEPSGSAATARENDTNSDREQLSRSSQSDRNFELPQAPHPDSRMRATTSYPGLHSHTMAFDIDPLENLSALNAMSEQERALRQEFAASDSDSDNDDSSTPPAADYQLPPGVDPPTPSPENSPEPSPRNLLDAADNAAAVGGFRRASSPTPPKFNLPHSNYSSESTQSSSAPPRRPKAETTVSRSSNPLVRSETHGTAIDIMNDIMGGGEAADDNATLAAPAVPPKRRSRSPDAPRLPPKKSERVKKHDTQAASIAAAAQAAMANRKPGARQLSPRERQVTARNQAGGGPFRKAGRGRGRGAAPLPVPPKKAAAAAAATPSSPGDPPPTPPGTPPLPDPQSTYDVVPPLESTYDQVEVPDMPTSLDTSTTTLQPDDTYQQIPLAPADSTESSTTHTTASELPPWGGDMVSVNLDREGNAPMRVRTVSQADRAAEENKC